ncbi:G-alpha-domain-containing protein [Macrolepiota fuliginosa MF-IS2]|uniref:G-alpha-domain-containing protein n=1 Tax=Macrolepiota fuliginosa MF-IS2 TaxID=1400762 RepID=A0A9P6C1E6_9AGAR|nr:G-alpha-domain-containing protein [Macrolepiota fuliginosa MF-IS2]
MAIKASKDLSADTINDPLAQAIAPPPHETLEEREKRLEGEKEAKRVSDVIDEEIDKEKRREKPMKILLLGQSESGKSTTLKNFQLMYEPKAFRQELACWRAIIQLNVVQSFHLIMDAMDQAQRGAAGGEEIDHTTKNFPPLTTEHLRLKQRLLPLLQIEDALIQRLSPVSSKQRALEGPRLSFKEVAVNSSSAWKECFQKLLKNDRDTDKDSVVDWDDPTDPGRVLHACSEDMICLWSDPVIQQLLVKLKLRMQEHTGFFLDALERVTAPRYLPSDDDILRARLKTLGVTEHHFRMRHDAGFGKDWRIYDVGGQRSQVPAWIPYFDHMDAIIFLTPISAFDQVLEEDSKVNRLQDSVHLWKEIISNELLRNTNIILFLNKIDIFQAKLEAGIRFADYVTSYGDRPNDFENTSAYLKKKFASILKSHSKTPRILYCHLTTVTDTKSTGYILTNLHEMLMRQNLVNCNLT